MITIFCALYPEALGLIRHLGLSREDDNIFSSSDFRLILTGSGRDRAAAAAGYCLGKYGKDSLYVNYGSAAAASFTGDTFFAGQILEKSTGEAYYPDIASDLFPHCALITSDRPCGSYQILRSTFDRDFTVPVLFDMEASSIFAVLKSQVSPERIIFIKTVTDSGEFNYNNARNLILKASEPVSSFLLSLCRDNNTNNDPIDLLSEQLSGELSCSESMKIQLFSYIRYLDSASRLKDLTDLTDSLRNKGELPVKDKRQGKKILSLILSLCIS